MKPTLRVDYAPMLVETALAGLGVTQLFDDLAEPHLRSGRLTELLAGEATDGPDIHAVCAPGRRASPRVRAAFSAFADAFGASSP